MLITVEGIVIRTMDYGEGNKIITLYTRELGKAAVMARGAKKLKSRLSAVTQLFTYGHYVVYRSGSSQMGTLNSGEIIDSYQALRENLHYTAYASYIAEMTDRVLGEQDGSAYMFEQLAAALSAVVDGKDGAIITYVFEMKMLTAAGYAPVLHECASCGGEIAIDAIFLGAKSGGVICSRCRHTDSGSFPVSATTLKLLRLFLRLDLRQLGNIDVKESTKDELKQCVRAFMDTYIDIRWKSRDFLDHLEKL